MTGLRRTWRRAGERCYFHKGEGGFARGYESGVQDRAFEGEWFSTVV